MSFFNKIGQGARTLFNKVGGNDGSFFRKVGNTARKVDNSIARVGNFLASSANSMGLNPVAGMINAGTNAAHQIRNNLERSIKAPISNIRGHYN